MTRTAAETDMAHFWSENFVAQWNRTLRAIADVSVPDTGDSARLFALASLAAADAAITAWKSKIHFNYCRPITAIREGNKDPNKGTIGDPNWSSLIATPPYPDYSSGANNLTGAFTTILQESFGTDDFSFSITSNAALAVLSVRIRLGGALQGSRNGRSVAVGRALIGTIGRSRGDHRVVTAGALRGFGRSAW